MTELVKAVGDINKSKSYAGLHHRGACGLSRKMLSLLLTVSSTAVVLFDNCECGVTASLMSSEVEDTH